MINAILQVVSTLGGLIVPPAFDFIKSKFVKDKENQIETTLSALASTKPDAMPAFMDAYSKLIEAKIKYFNRDIIIPPSTWIIDLRAAIRPIILACCLIMMPIIILLIALNYSIDEGILCFIETIISSWFGSRLKFKVK